MALLRPTLALFACTLAGAFFSAPAGATSFGVADDTGKYADDGGRWFFAQMIGIGLTENRIAIPWDATRPTVIPEQAFLDRSLPIASFVGVRLIASVYPLRARALSESPDAPAQFVDFLRLFARRYPNITDFVVGNEPNLSRFWQPQFNPDGSPASGAAYETLLADSYDALKAINPRINVIGVGLSSRGNDNPVAVSNISTSPVRFIQGMGAAYRASGRTRPIMDELGFHPYPRSSKDSLDAGYQWPNAGVANLDRVKQAVWDAFSGTGQPTFENGLTLAIDEVGWQVQPDAASATAYYGNENTSVTDESHQAQLYHDLVRRLSCDRVVSKLLFFGLVDESDLGGFQAALLRADRTRRPAYEAVGRGIAETGGRCADTPITWRHATTVAGAAARFKVGSAPRPRIARSWSFEVTAAEDARYEAGIFRADGSRVESGRLGDRALLSTSGRIDAYWHPLVRFPSSRLRPGTYVYRVRITADTNPRRSTLLVSPRFRVGR
jgi:hypothetical protein